MTAFPQLGLGRLSALRIERLLAVGAAAEPTYAPVGDLLEVGARASLEEERVVGAGFADFQAAVACLGSLAPQRGLAEVWPGNAKAEAGTTVLIALRFGTLTLVAIDRIVAVVDEPCRWGFAYGTLPGHAEVGEEAFVVERGTDDVVVARVVAEARAAVPGARLLQPLTVPVQRWAARRYLQTVADAVAHDRVGLR